MAKIKIILDKRRANRDNSFPVRLYIYHREQIRLALGMNATVDEWDAPASSFIPANPQARAKNARLRDIMNRCEMLMLNLSVNGELEKMTAKMLAARIQQELNMSARGKILLTDYLERAKRGKAERTVRLFTWAQQRVADFDEYVTVTDVTEGWVTRFRDTMLRQKYSPNTVAQGMAWVSRALSLAVADGVIARNPCTGVRKPKAETRKKYLSLDKMRMLRDMTFEDIPIKLRKDRILMLEYARDMFMLQFYLLGINIVDLMDLKDIVDGRVEYVRHKTGTLYSVKVHPEAMEIIARWRGNGWLVENKHGTAANACSIITYHLKEIIPGLSTNWARHTWASMAAELEIPIETISHALGHKIGSPVTAIYVAYNQKKVDAANRRVIDYLNADLKGKK